VREGEPALLPVVIAERGASTFGMPWTKGPAASKVGFNRLLPVSSM
jgi:hypothetical protein